MVLSIIDLHAFAFDHSSARCFLTIRPHSTMMQSIYDTRFDCGGRRQIKRSIAAREAHNDPIHRRIILTSSGLFALHVATFLTPADRSRSDKKRSGRSCGLRTTSAESVIRDARIEVEDADVRAAPPGDRGLSSPAIAFLPCVCCLGVACPTKRYISQPTHG